MPPGFRRCSVGLYREHFAKACTELAKHDCVDPGTVQWRSERLHYVMDLSLVPNGHGPAIELVIARGVEAAVRK